MRIYVFCGYSQSSFQLRINFQANWRLISIEQVNWCNWGAVVFHCLTGTCLQTHTLIYHSTNNKQEQVAGNNWCIRAGPSYSTLSNSSVHTWHISESLKRVPNGIRRSFFWPSAHLQALQTAHSWTGFLGPSNLIRLPCCLGYKFGPRVATRASLKEQQAYLEAFSIWWISHHK